MVLDSKHPVDMKEAGKGDHPSVVLVGVRIGYSMGYNLTQCNAMVRGVPPSNQANREQIAGRIDRISQKASHVHHVIVHKGITTAMLRNHVNAQSLSDTFRSMAKIYGDVFAQE